MAANMKMYLSIIWLVLIMFCGQSFGADSGAEALIDSASSTVAILKRLQKEKDRWALEKTALIKQRNGLKNDIEDLTSTKADLELLLDKTRKSVAELEQATGVKDGDSLSGDVDRLLRKVLGRLETRVEAGLPFLLRERGARLDYLRELLDDEGVTLGEKYRRIMEAVLIEAEYAGSVEVYQETVTVQGDELTVNVLRVGSGALFYQSPDGLNVGRFSRDNRLWESLPDKYVSNITRAMEIARHQRAAEIVELPLGKVVN